MKVVLFDPLYSSVGHFYRYNQFIVRLLAKCSPVTSIEVIATNKELLSLESLSPKVRVVYFPSKVDSMQVKSMKAHGLQKAKLALSAYKEYKSIINRINESNCDLAFFTSQGLVSFWLAARGMKVRYVTSVVSIKWIYESRGLTYPLYFLYRQFIGKSTLNLFFETYYQGIVNRHVETTNFVMPDRALHAKQNPAVTEMPNGEQLHLVTLGTISRIKSPVAFLQQWKNLPAPVVSGFRYSIHGKVMDPVLSTELTALLKDCSGVNFVDDYISEEAYEAALENADFAVIPYSQDYTNYATSGVMWDCFERQKPILCPNIEPFRYYISTFGIGFLYEEGKLEETLREVVRQKESFFAALPQRYQKLAELNSESCFTAALLSFLKSVHN